jgi:hypothetical protein
MYHKKAEYNDRQGSENENATLSTEPTRKTLVVDGRTIIRYYRTILAVRVEKKGKFVSVFN